MSLDYAGIISFVIGNPCRSAVFNSVYSSKCRTVKELLSDMAESNLVKPKGMSNEAFKEFLSTIITFPKKRILEEVYNLKKAGLVEVKLKCCFNKELYSTNLGIELLKIEESSR